MRSALRFQRARFAIALFFEPLEKPVEFGKRHLHEPIVRKREAASTVLSVAEPKDPLSKVVGIEKAENPFDRA